MHELGLVCGFYIPFSSSQVMNLSYRRYLATDMQFYWIAPLILLAFHKSHRLGLTVWSTVLLAATATSFALAYVYHLSPNALWGLPHSPYEEPNPDAGDISALIYNKPWARIPCYLVGVFVSLAAAKALIKSLVDDLCLKNKIGMLTAYGYRFGRMDRIRNAPTSYIAAGWTVAVLLVCEAPCGLLADCLTVCVLSFSSPSFA
jgi:hypothetical protein